MHQSSSRNLIFCACFTLTLTQIQCSYHDELCLESRNTYKEVNSCPRTKSWWEDRGRRKNCSSIVHNCSGDLVYHCLINPWQNETIEVCAPITEINARFCAEYNMKGGRVQDYFEPSCSKCKKNYISTDAYIYTDCYDVAYKRRNSFTYMYVTSLSTATAATTTKTRIGRNSKSTATTTKPTELVLMISLTVFTVFVFLRRNRFV